MARAPSTFSSSTQLFLGTFCEVPHCEVDKDRVPAPRPSMQYTRVGLLGLAIFTIAGCRGGSLPEEMPPDGSAPDVILPDAGGDSPVDRPQVGRAPRIVQFTPDLSRVLPGGSVVFTAIVTDPDGIDDLIGGSLEDTHGNTYGAFTTAASEGAYSLSVTFAQMNSVERISTSAGGTTRTFRAAFFDQGENRTVSSEATVAIACEEASDAICQGACVDLSTSATHCGQCDRAIPNGGLCNNGTPTCSDTAPNDFMMCDDRCTNIRTSSLHCGQCGRRVPTGGGCVDGVPECAPGYRDCSGACTRIDQFACEQCGVYCVDPNDRCASRALVPACYRVAWDSELTYSCSQMCDFTSPPATCVGAEGPDGSPQSCSYMGVGGRCFCRGL